MDLATATSDSALPQVSQQNFAINCYKYINATDAIFQRKTPDRDQTESRQFSKFTKNEQFGQKVVESSRYLLKLERKFEN